MYTVLVLRLQTKAYAHRGGLVEREGAPNLRIIVSGIPVCMSLAQHTKTLSFYHLKSLNSVRVQIQRLCVVKYLGQLRLLATPMHTIL